MCALPRRQVGWIVVLMVVFNYITACMMMLGMQASDPFHFGKLEKRAWCVVFQWVE